MIWWVTQNLIVTAMLTGAVWLVCKTTRIGPATRHALWLVVLLKLLTPPLVLWPWGVPDLLAKLDVQSSVDTVAKLPEEPVGPVNIELPESFVLDSAEHETFVEPQVFEPTEPVAVLTEPLPMGVARPESAKGVRTRVPTPPRPSKTLGVPPSDSFVPTTDRSWSVSLLQVGGMTWLAGAVLFALIQITRIVRMSLRLRGAGAPDEVVAKQIATMIRQLEMRPVETRVVVGIGSPFVWAFMRPRLLWPTELPADLPNTALQGLIVHELAHVKRLDHWVGWLELIAGCVWWWNPLFWYVRHQLRENAELACDAWVVGTLPAGRRAYAEALLAVCECVSKLTAPLPAVGATASGRHAIERRLNMILRGQSPFRLSRRGLLAALVLAATALPAWSQRSQINDYVAVSGEAVSGVQGRSADWQPGELRVLLGRYEQQEADLRREAAQQAAKRREALIKELQAMQDQFTREGLLDEAVAVRDQIRKISSEKTSIFVTEGYPKQKIAKPDSYLRLPPPLPPGANAPPISAPGGLSSYRDRVGQVLSFEVVGTTERPVWGSGVYTDDSDLGTAAVHAGLLEPGKRNTVHVIIGGPLGRFEGSTRNGVTTSSYGPWQGSFAFYHFASSAQDVASDPTTLYEYRDRVGQILAFNVTGSTDGTVWGSEVYTDDSPLATAAVHAGMLQPGQQGVVRVLILPRQTSYSGSTKNGITTHNYQTFGGSYRFLPVQVDPGHLSPISGLPGRVPGGGAPPATGGFEGFSSGGSTLTQYRDRVGETISIPVVGITSGTVWGSEVYTDDSSVETAAVHAGLLSPGESGTVRVKILPGRENYEGSTENGVTTRDYSAWDGSFQFEPSDKPKTLRGFRWKSKEKSFDAAPGTKFFDGSSKETLVDLSKRKVGESFEVVVTGATDGPVWGDKVYTDDSSVATAAVHVGLLKEGEPGLIRVTMLEGKPEYEGSIRNGVTSRPWKEWERSFGLDPVEKVFVPQTPALR